jgi:PAS domain S-box-containing protein
MGKKHSDREEALRVSESKYRTLFDSIDEGFCIVEVLFDENEKPRDYRFLEINSSFERQTGIVNGVGKRMRELKPRHEEHWFEIYGKVALTGEAARFQHYAEHLGHRWYDVYAFRLGEANERQVAILFKDITERKRAEDALRTSEARQTFLLKLSDTLRPLSDPIEIQQAAMRVLGDQLEVDRVLYGGVDDGENYVVSDKYGRDNFPKLVGLFPGSAFGEVTEWLRKGETIAVHDMNADARLGEATRSAFIQAGVYATVAVPLIKGGRWVANFGVHHGTSRRWTDEEIALVQETAERTWAAIERVKAEEDLRRSEERLRLIIESAKGYAIFTADADGVINSWNAGAAHTFGWSEAEILGQKTDVTFTPEDRAADEPQKELETARAKGIAPDIRWHLRKDGSRVFINGVVHLMHDGQLNGFLKIGRDLTAQRHAEEALREHQKQLQVLNETLEQRVQKKTAEVHQLASDVIKATQQERQRISRVLHDDLQQRVYAIQMQMSFLRDGLPIESETARREVSDIEKEISEIVKIIRDFSIDLSPPILPGEGLSHAIEWLATRMGEQYALPVELQANGPFVIPNEELHVLLFTCVRELLFNVVKHAGASRAVVALAWLDHGLQIEVRDDGKGFPDNLPEVGISKQDDLPRSLGLPTIRHQISLFGGRMEINSKPGAGTQIILTVPTAKARPEVSSASDTL